MKENIYNKNVKIKVPESVEIIINTLQEKGYEAYAVGGCVRDSVLGIEPKDWDITTSAKPEEIKALFRRTVDTGIKHGTVTILLKGIGYEVTTYRIDGEYEDSRHPKEVLFTSSLEEDLKRRDFTINAMAYNSNNGIVDCFGGIEDLNSGIIRCVGDPQERFTEDALRILRAVRFAAVLNFDIEDETKHAIDNLSYTLTKISKERIQSELDKLLMSDGTDRVRQLYETGIIKWIFYPEDEGYKKDDINKLVSILKNSPKDHYIRWAVFISFVSAKDILRNLKFDNKTIKICNKLKEHQYFSLFVSEPELRKAVVIIGRDIFGQYYIPYRKAMKNVDCVLLDEIVNLYNLILQRGDCLSVKEMAIKGSDLIQIGVEPGVKMGEVIEKLFEMIIEDHTINQRDTLLKIARNYT